MATAAARQKELEPDWRDRLRDSMRRLLLRSWGIVLTAIAVAGALALASHNSTDPSFTTAAAGPPANWLGPVGAYSSDLLLLLFGLGSVLFVPVVLLAGLRRSRAQPPGRTGRALSLAALAAILFGIALGLTSGSAVSGLPSGWGGVVGLAVANGLDALIGLIPDHRLVDPARIALMLIFAAGGLAIAYFALGLTDGERSWLGALFSWKSRPRSVKLKRKSVAEGEKPAIAQPPKSKPSVAVSERSPAPAPRTAANARKTGAQPTLALGDYVLPDVGDRKSVV